MEEKLITILAIDDDAADLDLLHRFLTDIQSFNIQFLENKYGGSRITVSMLGCGPCGLGSTPSYRPQSKEEK